MSPSINPEFESEIKDAFAVFDKDGDNKISSKELGVVMRSIGLNPTEAELQDMISEADNAGSGFIQYEKFKNIATKKVSGNDAEDEVREAFRIFDKKNTGFINSIELKHVLTTLGEKLSEDEANDIISKLDPENTGEINIDRATSILCAKN